jgi:hypothetical protein
MAYALAVMAALEGIRVGADIYDIVMKTPSVAYAYDRNGTTLLHCASRLGRADAVWVLTLCGAAPESINLAGERAVPLDAPAWILASVADCPSRLVMM